MLKQFLFTACLTLLTVASALAQQTVSGTITAENGDPLIGVNVVEAGTVNGVLTDLDGKYSIEVSEGASITFSYTGFETVTLEVGNQSTIDITLKEGVQLDEVVVTALGVEKQKKALTYSVTELAPEGFSEARETNVVNSLAGKVAGVNVASTATGAGGSSRVIIRGNNSLSGNNQPLYVIDGVPIDNKNLGSAGMWGGADGGDGISSINPEDIESISVLKGTSAAALYGYRSANGVIEITTKSGSGRRGIGVEFSSQLRLSSLNDTYDFQKEYGHGRDGTKPTTQAEALAQGLYSWGERLDGSSVMQFDGVSRPYSDAGNNADRFYRTGSTWINTLTLTGGSDKVNFRFSASNMDNKDILPNSGLTRRNFTLRTNAKVSERLTATLSAMYVYEDALNRPRLSDSPGNANYTALSLPASINVEDLMGDPNKLGAIEDGTELQFNDNIFVTNPYWAAYQFENNTQKNRLLGKIQLQYDLTDDLYVRGKVGLDRYNYRRRNLTPYGTAYSPFGQISETNNEVQELNTEILLGFDKDLTDNISLTLFAGGNQQRNFDETLGGSGSQFNVPFLHSIVNTANRSVSFGFGEWQVNSLFGSAELGLMRSIYLSGTYRNDWFSTLTTPDGSSENNQGYYSAGISAVISELVDMPSAISFLKLRTSYATGSGPGVAASPYNLNLTYRIFGQGHLGNPLGGVSNGSIPNANLTPLLTKEFEAGFDLSLFGGRFDVDFTYYDRRTEGDIISAAVSRTSGFGSKIVNLGEMTNSGVEVLLNANIIRNENFSWDANFNFANNQNEVVSLLTPEQDDEALRAGESRTRNAYIEHVEGLPYSQIAGFAYNRNEDGEIIIGANGLPEQGEFTHFGTGVSPVTMGFGSTFRYKNLSLNFLIDMRSGGKLYSATNAFAYTRGLHQNTLVGRQSGIGPIEAANIEDYYQYIGGNITEQFVYDADFGKLRQVVLNYTLPSSVVEGLPVSSVTVGVAGRNLAILWSGAENIDPESNYNVGNAQGLEMFGVPATRNVQFNLNVKF